MADELPAIDRLLQRERATFRRLEPAEAEAAMRRGAVLIDTRSHEQRLAGGVVPGSIRIHRNLLEWRVDPTSGYQHPQVEACTAEVIVMCEQGFSSSLAAGSLTGVGAIWTWQTTRQVYSYTGATCTNDICLNRTTPADNRQFGPFGVPGRSLVTSGVTTTSESLTSSLITFFSPPTQLFSITSRVDQIAPGVFRYKEVLENNTGQPLTVNQSSGPYGCST